MRNNLRTVAANLAAFFSPAAFEARARRREQLKLRRELAEVDETLAWCKGREAFILERLAILGREESIATLKECKVRVKPTPQHFNCRSMSLPVIKTAEPEIFARGFVQPEGIFVTPEMVRAEQELSGWQGLQWIPVDVEPNARHSIPATLVQYPEPEVTGVGAAG